MCVYYRTSPMTLLYCFGPFYWGRLLDFWWFTGLNERWLSNLHIGPSASLFLVNLQPS